MDSSSEHRLDKTALGLGLRPSFYAALAQRERDVDFFEVLVENYLGPSPLPRANLRRIAQRYPLVGHGVSANLLGADPLDLEYLRRVRDFVSEFELPYMTDHLCWSAYGSTTHHDLLPTPYTRDLVAYAADRAARIQDVLGVPFGIENLSSYVAFERSDLTEWDFLRQVIEQSGCAYMLDLNNIYVSAMNHGFQPADYLQSVLWDRVLQVHVAGHRVRDDGLLHDTHDQPVCPDVWQLYRSAWQLGGPFRTVLEWDANIPPLDVAIRELGRARLTRETSSHPSKTLP